MVTKLRVTRSRVAAGLERGVCVSLALALTQGCGPSSYEPPRSGGAEGSGSSARGGEAQLPADAAEYTTVPGANGVRGGQAARDAQRLLEDELAERGDSAEPDGVLASAAAWLVDTAHQGEDHTSDALAIARATQRFGFAGLMLGSVAGSLADPQTQDRLRTVLRETPDNMRINRYGIVAGRGQEVAIVFGLVDVSLANFPRSVPPGGSLRLRGVVAERFERASVFVTRPSGKMTELKMSGRDVDATLEFPSGGVHQLEVLGDGKTGPVVLVNVPIQVGAAANRSPVSDARIDPNLTEAQAEATLLSLVNEERTQRGLGSVQPDAELRGVALAHSVDMTEHHFFGHVSPTTGTIDDRVHAAGVRVSKYGECLALESTPAGAERALMDSPAHRSAILDPSFNRVGIGVSFVTTDGKRRLNVALLFGRRPPPEEARLTRDELLAAIQALRKTQGVPALVLDPVLDAAAGAGTLALIDGSATDTRGVLAAVAREMQRQVNRTRTNRASCQLYVELIDRVQLAAIPLLARADVARVGLAVVPREDDTGPKLGVVLLADASPGKHLTCN